MPTKLRWRTDDRRRKLGEYVQQGAGLLSAGANGLPSWAVSGNFALPHKRFSALIREAHGVKTVSRRLKTTCLVARSDCFTHIACR